MTRVAPARGVLECGHALAPSFFGRRPSGVRRGEIERVVAGGEREQKVVVLSLRELERQLEQRPSRTVVACPGFRAGEPAKMHFPGAAAPTPVVDLPQRFGRRTAVATPRTEGDSDARTALQDGDAAQNQRAVAARRKRERLSALHNRIAVGRPAAVPDEATGLVVSAPHVAFDGRYGVHSRAADQRREHSIVVPARKAHPREVALRADDRAALAVCEQRVFAQDVRGVLHHPSRRSKPAATVPVAAASNPVSSRRCIVIYSW